MIQLVERDGGGDTPALEFRENPDHESFLTFEHDGFHAVLWGGPDLLVTAARLGEHGFRVTSVMVTDATGGVVDDEFVEYVRALVNDGQVDDALDLLSRDNFNAFVQAVTVASRAKQAQFRLLKFGGVEVIGNSAPGVLVSALSET